ncbi:succinate dehydrogenase iron-sulfur subunit [Ceratobasidium sp. AG-Ba]|nr:succinate dehydrogenase iron-sulfur subunit [Ceratobasidium sp. AG-Ba]
MLRTRFASRLCASPKSLRFLPPARRNSGLGSQYPIDPSPLPGTAPEHSFQLILQTPHPPQTWPPKLQTASPLLTEVSALLKQHGGLVNFAWAPPESDGVRTNSSPTEVWQHLDKPESYRGILYSLNKPPYTIPVVSKSSLPELSSIIPRASQFFGALGTPAARNHRPVDLYVCTHAARDCRCGDIGGEIVQILRERCAGRSDVRIFEIGHVGGHKWAGNVIVLPLGDWYGNLRPEDIPTFLDHVTSQDVQEPLWSRWRGRMGLSQDMQVALHRAATKPEETNSDTSTFTLSPLRSRAPDRPVHQIKFITWDGKEILVQAREGQNLMQVAKDANLEGVEGICGGNLECATCHMYIPPAAPLPRMSDAEDDMLAYAIKRKEGESRLGCQIDVTPELAAWVAAGGQITLPRF